MKNNKNSLAGVLALGIIIIGILLAAGDRAPELTGITVSGSSEITTEPNKAELFVSIETVEQTAGESKDTNAEVSVRVINALKRAGVSDEDIETSSFNLYRKERFGRFDSEPVFEGYAATHTLKVTTTVLDDVGNLVDIAVDNGANVVQQVSFGLTKEEEKRVKAQALDKAAKEGAEKADALAKSLGIRLGKVKSVSESSFFFAPFDVSRGAFAEAAVQKTQILPGDVEVSASVTLMYEIRQ